MKSTYSIFVSMKFGVDPTDPKNEWTKLFEGAIEPFETENEDTSSYKLKIVRADHTLKDLGLKEHVKRCIEECDIVLAVLSDSQNVFWEVGYAEALEKPIVFMANQSDINQHRIPVLAGQPIFFQYNHDLVVQASGSPEVLRQTLAPIRKNLGPYFERAFERVGQSRIGRLTYKVTAHGRREFAKLAELISHAQRRVDILTTNLDWLVTSDEFSLKKKSKHPFQEALGRGARIRIATMDPEAVIAEYRAKQLGEEADVPAYRSTLREGVRQLYSTFRSEIGRFNLRIYNELPLQITYIIDDLVVTGIIARSEKSRELIHVEFYKGAEGVTESFLNHFESLYNASADASRFNWVTRLRARKIPSSDAKAPSTAATAKSAKAG